MIQMLLWLLTGLLLGVVSFLFLERCCCSCASRSNVIPRVNPVRAYMSWPRFSGWRSARVRDPPSPPARHRLTDRPVQHPDVLSPEGVSPRGERWGLPAVEYPSTHGQSRKGAAQVTNIYRAAFNDNPIGGTVNKKRPDTYASGHTDWNM